MRFIVTPTVAQPPSRIFTAHADRELKALPESDQRRIIKKLKTYLASPEPLRHAEKIEGAPGKVYRFRVGALRIIFDWLGDHILVTSVGDRKDVYR